VTTGVLLSAGALLSTMAMPTAYARLAHLSYTSHVPQSGPASARPIREAVGQSQSTCADSIRVYSEAYVSRDGQRARVGDQVVEAEWDSCWCW